MEVEEDATNTQGEEGQDKEGDGQEDEELPEDLNLDNAEEVG